MFASSLCATSRTSVCTSGTHLVMNRSCGGALDDSPDCSTAAAAASLHLPRHKVATKNWRAGTARSRWSNDFWSNRSRSSLPRWGNVLAKALHKPMNDVKQHRVGGLSVIAPLHGRHRRELRCGLTSCPRNQTCRSSPRRDHVTLSRDLYNT